ncbi:hypothetical protein ATH33_0130 [Thermoactinomyces vulgaris]|jgi:hypothetical protein|nr:hypothetical protein ATH33_0130 [Thermoactinomyces vulgaris]
MVEGNGQDQKSKPMSDEELQKVTVGELKPTMRPSISRSMIRAGRSCLNGKPNESAWHLATRCCVWSMSDPPPCRDCVQSLSSTSSWW